METGTIISIVSVCIAFVALLMNSKKDVKADSAAMARIETSLSTLNSGVNDIRVDLRSMRDSLADHSERLARVEARAENNAHRLDVIEGKGGK